MLSSIIHWVPFKTIKKPITTLLDPSLRAATMSVVMSVSKNFVSNSSLDLFAEDVRSFSHSDISGSIWFQRDCSLFPSLLCCLSGLRSRALVPNPFQRVMSSGRKRLRNCSLALCLITSITPSFCSNPFKVLNLPARPPSSLYPSSHRPLTYFVFLCSSSLHPSNLKAKNCTLTGLTSSFQPR